MQPRTVARVTELFIEAAQEKDPVQRSLFEYKLYMYKYGYITEQESFSTHIKYNKSTRDFFHPFSHKAVGETFGFREYDKLIPIYDYLRMPVDVTEDILEGIGRGQQRLAKLKEQAAKQAQNSLAGKSDQVLRDAIAKGYKDV